MLIQTRLPARMVFCDGAKTLKFNAKALNLTQRKMQKRKEGRENVQ